MPALDHTVANLLDSHRTGDDSDEDALIAELEADENDPTLSHLRSERINQLHAEYTRTQILKQDPGRGTYLEVKDEKEILAITTSKATKFAVVHFKKSDFNRCRIMDERLAVLAEKHLDTRFVGVDVEAAPFLVVKLGIQVLPCVLCFVDAVAVDRIIGFEGVGKRQDDITVSELEQRLLAAGVLVRAKVVGDEAEYYRKRRVEEEEEAKYDDDWE
ncbi:hypothetical protein LTR62_007029 [Meristemomyces frigidus]|uniref:Thioredoxin-like protein n=1 Tax=Meristemomyces frigidus TaxID=1508187 RepID=A0AAN7YE44_9PEZI|nr:hypothetical protein LTR62_007029 [Meristemomyces frigidus]